VTVIIVKLLYKNLKEILMNTIVKANIVLLITAMSITGCSTSPEPKKDPYNQDDSQRSRAKQTQDELSSETSGKK
jgi:uncharacterized lipoprotein YmbA